MIQRDEFPGARKISSFGGINFPGSWIKKK
jgi:hypothetical protein